MFTTHVISYQKNCFNNRTVTFMMIAPKSQWKDWIQMTKKLTRFFWDSFHRTTHIIPIYKKKVSNHSWWVMVPPKMDRKWLQSIIKFKTCERILPSQIVILKDVQPVVISQDQKSSWLSMGQLCWRLTSACCNDHMSSLHKIWLF